MSLKNTHTKLTGHSMEIALSPDILGRTFNGIGQPHRRISDPFLPVKTGCKWSALKSGQTRVSAKLYPNRNFRHRRTDHPDPRTETSDFLRGMVFLRPAGLPRSCARLLWGMIPRKNSPLSLPPWVSNMMWLISSAAPLKAESPTTLPCS